MKGVHNQYYDHVDKSEGNNTVCSATQRQPCLSLASSLTEGVVLVHDLLMRRTAQLGVALCRYGITSSSLRDRRLLTALIGECGSALLLSHCSPLPFKLSNRHTMLVQTSMPSQGCWAAYNIHSMVDQLTPAAFTTLSLLLCQSCYRGHAYFVSGYRNHDGFITADELKLKLGSQADVSQLIAAADKNGDGKIDYAEFCELVRNS